MSDLACGIYMKVKVVIYFRGVLTIAYCVQHHLPPVHLHPDQLCALLGHHLALDLLELHAQQVVYILSLYIVNNVTIFSVEFSLQ